MKRRSDKMTLARVQHPHKGEFTQYPQCAFSYVFYVRKTHTLFSTETDKNGFANFTRFACTKHPQFPYIIFANIRMKQNNKIDLAEVYSIIQCQIYLRLQLTGLTAQYYVIYGLLISRHWFQIFLICGNLIDCIRRRY